jgi:hypothetical protein
VATNFKALIWSGIANKARDAAKETRDPDLKLRVLMVAARFLLLAKRAEANDHSSETSGET